MSITSKQVTLTGQALSALLWTSMLVVGVLWGVDIKIPFDPGPITYLLGVVSSIVTIVVKMYNDRLDEEEYSISYALADGYFNNFIEPLVTNLIDEHGDNFRLIIYIPGKLEELGRRAIERTLSRLRSADYSTDVVNLELEEGRARDVLTVIGSGADNCYFDFPNTLLTVKNLIDYKVSSEKNRLNEAEKKERASLYIAKFSERLKQKLKESGLDRHIEYTDQTLRPPL